MNGDEIVRPCDRHSNETVTLRKHVTKFINMRKWLQEFLKKIENRGIKIALDSYRQFGKFSVIYFNFVRCCG